MTTEVDTLANVERAPEQRPIHIPPLLPDLEANAAHWMGPAGAFIARWRDRALAAESRVAALERDLLRYRCRA